MSKELEIKIGIGDWHEEYSQAEADLSDAEKLAAIATKYTAAQLARMVIVAHELGHAKKRYIPENKPMLEAGAHLRVAQLLARLEQTVTLANGKNVTFREFVGPVRGDEDQSVGDNQMVNVPPLSPDQPFVTAQSEEGLSRALDYLHKRIPGYVMGRLKLIAANGGDVRAEAEKLKAAIDEMVNGLD